MRVKHLKTNQVYDVYGIGKDSNKKIYLIKYPSGLIWCETYERIFKEYNKGVFFDKKILFGEEFAYLMYDEVKILSSKKYNRRKLRI